MTATTAIIDYGTGNLGSIQNMLRHIGSGSVVTSDVRVIERSQKLILPGVGHFDKGMQQLRDRGLVDVLNRRVLEDSVPVLGICLGMQLMGKGSEEGKLDGLGWMDASFVRFRPDQASYPIRVPHMSWNYVKRVRPSALTANLDDRSRFYFVHAYHAELANPDEVILTTEYGYEYVSGFERSNILGVQFHPEKSHTFGMKLLQNFCEGYSWSGTENA